MYVPDNYQNTYRLVCVKGLISILSGQYIDRIIDLFIFIALFIVINDMVNVRFYFILHKYN